MDSSRHQLTLGKASQRRLEIRRNQHEATSRCDCRSNFICGKFREKNNFEKIKLNSDFSNRFSGCAK